MENYKNLKMGTKIGILVTVVLNVLIFSSVMGLIKDNQTVQAIKIAQIVANIISVISVCYYMFFSYKKPHGNSLRNIFMIFFRTDNCKTHSSAYSH